GLVLDRICGRSRTRRDSTCNRGKECQPGRPAMMPARFQVRTRIAVAAATVAAALLTGCGTGLETIVNEAASGSAGNGRIQGAVHGGQQPVSGSTVQLYAVTTEGYNAPATALLTVPVTSAASGSFSITGDYSCTGVDQVYIVATGGN